MFKLKLRGQKFPHFNTIMDLKTLDEKTKRELAKQFLLRKKVEEAQYLKHWKPWTCRHGGMHQSQIHAFNSTARRVIIQGGNRSGKTEDGAAIVAHAFLGTHPTRKNIVPCIIKVFGEDFGNHIASTILPKLLKFIPPSAIAQKKKNERGVIVKIVGINGSIIDLMSYDQEVTKFESFDADLAWFDEPPPYEVYEAVRRGLIDRQGSMLFTMTPLREPWIYNTFYVPYMEGALKDTAIFELRSDCNPYISEEEIEDLKKEWDEETIKTRIEGKFRHLSGLIYTFDRTVHLIPYFDWPKEWPVWMCIDPHPKKPHAITWLGVTPRDQLVVIDELKAACTIAELAVKIREKETKNRYRIVDRLCDTSIKALDRMDQWKLLADARITCRFPHKHDRVMPGIEKVQGLLRTRTDHEGLPYSDLVFRDNCRGHIKEIMSYVWHESGEKPQKTDDDYMDNVRYICDVDPKFNFNMRVKEYARGYT